MKPDGICDACREQVRWRAVREAGGQRRGTFTHYCEHNDFRAEVSYEGLPDGSGDFTYSELPGKPPDPETRI